jgi:predicted RNase H-like HicB family nuclease
VPFAHATQHIVSILVTRAEDLPGVWVSHCLNLDVISQGNSIREALEAVQEAVLMVLNDDESEGLDPFDRERAPDDCWQQLFKIMREGVPAQSVPDENEICALVTQMRFLRLPGAAVERMPEAWEFAALRQFNEQRCHKA